MNVTRTYLEMTERAALRPARVENAHVRVTRIEDCDPALWRHLYTEVGRAYHWIDRAAWSDSDIRAYLGDARVSLWVLNEADALAGYFELRRDHPEEGDVEIAYLGLMPGFTGRGLGGHLVTEATERGWEAGARRVWLYTSSPDHPAALPNYLKRGFRIFKTDQRELPDP